MAVYPYAITTVVTPPAAGDLIDIDTWKDDWSVTTTDDDGFIARTIARCSMAVGQYCNRTFGIATYQDIIRPERSGRLGGIVPGGRNPIQVSRFPLVSVASVAETDGTTATILAEGADYEVNYALGQAYRLDANGNPRNWPECEITIIYQAGYVLPGQAATTFPNALALPVDIQDATGRLAFARYSERRRDPYIRSQSITAGGTTSYWEGHGASGNLTPDIQDLLDNYRVPLVG